METVPINNEKYLLRELSSKAILSTDRISMQRYKEQTTIIERNKQQISEVDVLKKEVALIKDLLQQILFKL